MKKAIVIGGGFGGMAAALRLRAKGYAVDLYDRCERLGGRAQVFERDGFRHDAGPTVITAPFLIDELFQLFGKKREDYIDFIPLDPWYRFTFPDGASFDYGGSVEDTLEEIGKFSKEDQGGYKRLVEVSKAIFDIGFDQLADRPFHRFGTMAAQLPHLLRLKSHRTVWQLVSSHIKHPQLRQAFSIQPLLVGGNPFDTTCIYNLIHYLERRWGIYFAKGGTGGLVDALARLMREEGIGIHLSSSVKHITFDGRGADGIMLESGAQEKADIVVSNADAPYLYAHMVPQNKQGQMLRFKQKTAHYSMGLFVLFFGTRKQYPDIAHHTIWMGKRYKSLLHDIFNRKILPEDFSLYLHRPTATDPDFAPDGCDSFYVLCPVPNLQGGQDWSQEGPRLQARILDALDQTIMPGLKETIAAPFYMTPEDFAENYLTLHGTGFSVAPLFRQSAWFRFHNKAEGLENLYLVGAGTHPGGGIPGVLSSAKVLDHLIHSLHENEKIGNA